MENYVNPKATCPNCGSRVFFHQSPNGGSVLFNALDPPWPKHPCTDARGSLSTPRVSSAPKRSSIPACKLDGRMPFLLSTVSRYSPSLPQADGSFEGCDLQLYLSVVMLDCRQQDPKELLQCAEERQVEPVHPAVRALGGVEICRLGAVRGMSPRGINTTCRLQRDARRQGPDVDSARASVLKCRPGRCDQAWMKR